VKYTLAPKSQLSAFLETYKPNSNVKWDITKLVAGDWLSEQQYYTLRKINKDNYNEYSINKESGTETYFIP